MKATLIGAVDGQEKDEGSRESNERSLWTMQQTAEALSVSVKTVSRLIADGELPAIRIRSRIRIQKTDVFDFLECQKRYNLGCAGSTVRDPKGERSCRINTPTAGIATVGSRTPLQAGGLTDLLERRKRRKPTPSNVSGG